MRNRCPRLVIAGMSGDSGKTLVTLGLIAALRLRGLDVAPFKKGPDYIDAAWLTWIAGKECRNLDVFLMGAETVRSSFIRHSIEADFAVVEGNRGLYDGMDAGGSFSTAELAKLIDAPVILVVGAKKATRTVAAWILGCQTLDKDLSIAGVILNGISGERHERVTSEAVESICGIPVLGSLPPLKEGELLPDRHLGLVTPFENRLADDVADTLARVLQRHVDLEAVLRIAGEGGTVETWPEASADRVPVRVTKRTTVRIGLFRDSAFTFYYPENIEALVKAGAELVPISSMDDEPLPDLDGLYIGGGFPETHAARLSSMRVRLESVKAAAKAGMPVYAECGGLIYLAESLLWEGNQYPMAGVLPVTARINTRPMGHGYVRMTVDRENPFFPVGMTLKGHEFHYSDLIPAEGDGFETVFRVDRGTGIGGQRDGIRIGNVFATYLHLHALGTPEWAVMMVQRVLSYRSGEEKTTGTSAY